MDPSISDSRPRSWRGATSSALFVGLGFFVAALPVTTPALGFGGEQYQLRRTEDRPDGNPWHHYDITRRGAAGDLCFLDAGVRSSADLTAALQRCQVSSADEIAGDKYAAGTIGNHFGGAGFSRDAALQLAWHADWLDSYLYNPLFRLGGVQRADFDRWIRSNAIANDLETLHFDDLFSSAAMQDTYDRYLGGTLLGLNWAAEHYARDPDEALQSAFHVVGVSLHAIQDFYSHSTWLDDPTRRTMSWFRTAPQVRKTARLSTGSYETDQHRAPHNHGEFAWECSVYSSRVNKPALAAMCNQASPLQNEKVCKQYRSCKDAQRTKTQASFSGRGIMRSNKLLFLDPVGINVDSTVAAVLGAYERGLIDENGLAAKGTTEGWLPIADCPVVINHMTQPASVQRLGCAEPNAHASRIFATAKARAVEASTEWLDLLGRQASKDPKTKALWAAMKAYRKTANAGALRERQYEKLSLVPFQFLTAGPYPVEREGESSGYYLRLEVITGSHRKAGTDSDIAAVVDGTEHVLDYLPASTCGSRSGVVQCTPEMNKSAPRFADRVFSYNDFEGGRATTYTVGPFLAPPSQVTFRNRRTKPKQIVKAFARETKAWFKDAGRDVADKMLSLVGGHADPIGHPEALVLGHDELFSATASGPLVSLVTLNPDNRGKNGSHTVRVRVARRGACASEESSCSYDVTLLELEANKESKRDRMSRSDEVFVLSTLSTIGESGTDQALRSGILRKLDAGERRALGVQFQPVTLGHGEVLSLVLAGYESDKAGTKRGKERAEREANALLKEMETGIKAYASKRRGTFASSVGAAIRPDWRPSSIRVYGFLRSGQQLQAGYIGALDRARWVGAGDEVPIALDWSSARRLPFAPTSTLQWIPSAQLGTGSVRVPKRSPIPIKVPASKLPKLK